jgi:hypothetical protein
MLSSQSDPKDISEWIELDYFNRPRALGLRRKYIVRGSWLGALAIGGVLAFLPFMNRTSANRIYEAAPVSRSHTMFGDDCRRCHVDSFASGLRFIHQNDGLASVKDTTCNECHPMKDHQDNQAFTPACSHCHREHRGNPVLSDLSDAECAACHARLETNPSMPKKGVAVTVTSFEKDHPPFGAWEGEPKDPGKIRFNHRVHLQKDGILVLDSKQQTLLGFDTPEVKRRLLKCEDCHRQDPAGQYMMPIQYELHCKECHPLSVQIAHPSRTKELERVLAQFRREPAPHPPGNKSATKPLERLCAPAKSTAEPFVPVVTVRAVLRERFTAFIRPSPNRSAILGKASDEPARPIPGKRYGESVSKAEWDWVAQQLETTDTLLFTNGGGCSYCHGQPIERRSDGLPTYALPQIRDRWFCYSRFSHEAHRAWDCLKCHADAPSSSETGDVLMPKIGQCRECHKTGAGARSECVECHLYHPRPIAAKLNHELAASP